MSALVPARRPRPVLPVLVAAVPPVALAAIGVFHPQGLNPGDAVVWRDIHLVGLFLFPFLAVPPWLLLRRIAPAAAIAAGVLGYVFACGYTALDVLAGIGAGSLEVAGLGGQPTLYHPADVLGRIGTIAYLAATIVTVVILLPRGRARLRIPGAVLVLAGAVSFLTSHIYPPRGVLTMLAFAVGWTLLTLAARADPEPGAASPGARDS